jgi:hypothetical protein
MNLRARLHDTNNILAWVILGYLCSHPEAKDTAVGIGKWWLRIECIEADMDRVRSALEYLVRYGWLVPTQTTVGSPVYGLNKERLPVLQSFMQGRVH